MVCWSASTVSPCNENQLIIKMCGRVLISLCLVATTAVFAKPQMMGQRQANGYGNMNGNGQQANGYGNMNGNMNGNAGRQLEAQPQNGAGDGADMGGMGAMMPMNYDFQWEVNDEESSNFYGHKEAADNGRVDGSYHVWLPNGRLMRVEYYVEGNSGFVPKITYEDAYEPTWGTSYFTRRRR